MILPSAAADGDEISAQSGCVGRSLVRNQLNNILEEIDSLIDHVEVTMDDRTKKQEIFAGLIDTITSHWETAVWAAETGLHQRYMHKQAYHTSKIANRQRTSSSFRQAESELYLSVWNSRVRNAGFDPLDTSTRRRHCPGLSFHLHPRIKSITIRDLPTMADRLLQKMWFRKIYMLNKKLFGICLPLALLTLPVSFMACTDTDVILFPGQTNVTNASAVAAYTPPWSHAVSDVSIFLMYLGSISAALFTTVALLNTNKDMRVVIHETMRVRVISVIFLNVAYTLLAIISFPSMVLSFYLIVRLLIVTYFCYVDADVARLKLRMHPAKFSRQYGGDGKKSGTEWIFQTVLLASLILLDTFRHYLLLIAINSGRLFTVLRVRNPITGRLFALTNNDLIDSAYFTIVIFLIQTAARLFSSNANETLSNTGFVIG